MFYNENTGEKRLILVWQTVIVSYNHWEESLFIDDGMLALGMLALFIDDLFIDIYL